ncbi:hypothetical protein D3C78_1574530 [compost metagenome]
MMPKCQFSSPYFLSKTIKRTPSESRTKRAGCFTFRNFLLDDRISILVDYIIINPFTLKKLRQNMLRKTRLFLIKIYSYNAKSYLRNALEV